MFPPRRSIFLFFSFFLSSFLFSSELVASAEESSRFTRAGNFCLDRRAFAVQLYKVYSIQPAGAENRFAWNFENSRIRDADNYEWAISNNSKFNNFVYRSKSGNNNNFNISSMKIMKIRLLRLLSTIDINLTLNIRSRNRVNNIPRYRN